MKKNLFILFVITLSICSVYGQEKPTAFINAKIIPIVGQPIEQEILLVQNDKVTVVGDARTVRFRCQNRLARNRQTS